MGVPVGQNGVTGIGGMLVMCRWIEFLGHVRPPCRVNAATTATFPRQCRQSDPIGGPAGMSPNGGHGQIGDLVLAWSASAVYQGRHVASGLPQRNRL
jgi:hypothetical protein